MRTLIIAEHTHTKLGKTTFNLVTAAKTFKQDIDILIAGFECDTAASEAASISGIKQILKADSKEYAHQLAENMADLVVKLAKNYTHILAPANTFGRNILPRAAALLDIQPVANVMRIVSPDTFARPVYAGNAIKTVKSKQPLHILTIRPTNFTAASRNEYDTEDADIITVSGTGDKGLSTYLRRVLSDSRHPPLSHAAIVVAGGKALASKTNFKLIEDLAETLDGAVGATRSAVDAGYIANEHQIGQTGQVIAPDLYIAAGISGAPQHVSGIKDSKTIIAINTDKDAPIFNMADYGIKGDLFNILPELIKRLKN